VEVLTHGGGFGNCIKEYLHQFYAKFEHKLHYGGGSGDSGGIFAILIEMLFFFTILKYFSCFHGLLS
jgi:hypothetical protein